MTSHIKTRPRRTKKASLLEQRSWISFAYRANKRSSPLVNPLIIPAEPARVVGMPIAREALTRSPTNQSHKVGKEKFMKRRLSRLFALTACLTVTGCVERANQANKNTV